MGTPTRQPMGTPTLKPMGTPTLLPLPLRRTTDAAGTSGFAATAAADAFTAAAGAFAGAAGAFAAAADAFTAAAGKRAVAFAGAVGTTCARPLGAPFASRNSTLLSAGWRSAYAPVPRRSAVSSTSKCSWCSCVPGPGGRTCAHHSARSAAATTAAVAGCNSSSARSRAIASSTTLLGGSSSCRGRHVGKVWVCGGVCALAVVWGGGQVEV
eukprot:365016-Chlamydomonas_euryale.AAC.5